MSMNGVGHSEDDLPPAPKKAKPKKLEDIYQKKTQLEHILLRPDTYIGSIERVKELAWVIEDNKLVQKEVNYVPGLYKIFDEILVNAADNKQRDGKMDTIKINIDQENNVISIWNNGEGIPVVKHEKENMLIPTMIFGHLLTSSNFDDDERKVTGGRNGYGAKLCNVFSTKFTVQTANRKYKKAFKQTWENNMSKAHEAKLKEYSGQDFTEITFKPDLAKFKMEKLEDDIVAIFTRRAYDVAAATKVKVMLNSKPIPVKNFNDYIKLFIDDKKDDFGNQIKFQFEAPHERWEIAIAPSDSGFQQISFVNSIATTKGGRHVDYIADMCVKKLVETIKKKNKNGIEVKNFQIKNHIWIFVNCLIENPTFDSQTKENMTLQSKTFGSKCTLSEKFFTNLVKSGIVESVLQWAKFKADNLLSKAQSGTKKNKIKGIPKLEDANDAGTKNAIDCTLILTEGDSAKTLAVAGLGIVGRDKYGVFPLRGKLLNVREANNKQIMENAEISALIKIIGLQYKRKYTSFDDMKTLRYGKLMIMTDQDHDGSHIKGLIINFIHHNWPNLLQMKFLEQFITPIVKASKGTQSISFFSQPELEEWKKTTSNWKSYKIKYYKGLGTSTSKEAKEYFSDMARHRIKFKYLGNQDDENITMAFSKKLAEERKGWLSTWMEQRKRRFELGLPEDIIYNSSVNAITYTDFVNKELILYSNEDNERSIPCLVDGFKPGQRKVLFTCFKRNDKREVKVAQLAGSVAEHSAYHHGEVSLMSTIINLAQNYVGSNNINLLQPIGQFGTRLQGGKDSASPRYIFTMLSSLARILFDPRDDYVLQPQFEDNMKIEPVYYCPLIPMVLVNGADGIGTGWMTKIPNFNPREIVANIRRLIRGEETFPMQPWYKKFRGDIMEIHPGVKYAINGEVSILSDTKIEITELPIGTWTQNYKESTMEVMLGGNEKQATLITDYKEYHTDTTVKFVVSMKPDQLSKYEEEGLHKIFKLQSTSNLSNMVLHDATGVLKRYNSVDEILLEFFAVRIGLYKKRRDYLLGMLGAEALKLSNQARFILEKCSGKLVVENKKKKLMIEELYRLKYDSDPVKIWKNRENAKLQILINEDESVDGNQEHNSDEEEAASEDKDYDYLLGMPIWSLTLERKEALLKQRDVKQEELEKLKKKSQNDLYNEDLDVFVKELDRVEKEEDQDQIETKKKFMTKKTFSRKAITEAAPSPMGSKVVPRIDEMIKKADLVKSKKEGGGTRGRKKAIKEEVIIDDEEDEFDRMIADADISLSEKIERGESDKSPVTSKSKKPPAAGKGKAKAGAAAANGEKKPRKPREPKKKKDDDGMKQTKLNFKSKAKSSPKKGRGGKKRKSGSSSEEEEDSFRFSNSDSDDFEVAKPKPTKSRQPTTAGPSKKLKLDSDSDDVLLDSPPKKKAAGPAGGASKNKKKVVNSDSDDDIAVLDSPSPPKKKAGGASKNKKKVVSDSDDDFDISNSPNSTKVDFDSLVSSVNEREKRPGRAARPKAKYVFDDDDDEEEEEKQGFSDSD